MSTMRISTAARQPRATYAKVDLTESGHAPPTPKKLGQRAVTTAAARRLRAGRPRAPPAGEMMVVWIYRLVLGAGLRRRRAVS
jgi:hypothetical protein